MRIICEIKDILLSLCHKGRYNMNYTKKTIRIKNPSPKLLSLMERLRDNKREQLERLRRMKPEEFDMRISL